jgi:hypothetical protein
MPPHSAPILAGSSKKLFRQEGILKPVIAFSKDFQFSEAVIYRFGGVGKLCVASFMGRGQVAT